MDYGAKELNKILNKFETMSIDEYKSLYEELNSLESYCPFYIITDNFNNQITFSNNARLIEGNFFDEIDDKNIIIQNNDQYVISDNPLAA